jgi:hypothetical protein
LYFDRIDRSEKKYYKVLTCLNLSYIMRNIIYFS